MSQRHPWEEPPAGRGDPHPWDDPPPYGRRYAAKRDAQRRAAERARREAGNPATSGCVLTLLLLPLLPLHVRKTTKETTALSRGDEPPAPLTDAEWEAFEARQRATRLDEYSQRFPWTRAALDAWRQARWWQPWTSRQPYDADYQRQWYYGARFGYPICCIEAFIERVMIGGQTLEADGPDGRIMCPGCAAGEPPAGR